VAQPDEHRVVRNAEGRMVRKPMDEPAQPLRLPPTELQPGLVVRELQPSERARCYDDIRRLGAADLYPDPERTFALWGSRYLMTVVAWRDRILQYDGYTLVGNQLHAGLTLRPERDRPAWFWRECRRPVWDMLLAAGFTKMQTVIRGDRADWIAVMQDMWALREWGRRDGGKWIVLNYDIPASRARCVGWPARRTLGAAWRWTDGALSCREAGEQDLAMIRAWLGDKAEPECPRDLSTARAAGGHDLHQRARRCGPGTVHGRGVDSVAARRRLSRILDVYKPGAGSASAGPPARGTRGA
jgi:hypothetical protein